MDFKSWFEKNRTFSKKLSYLKSLFQLVVCSVKKIVFSKSFGEIVSLVKKRQFFYKFVFKKDRYFISLNDTSCSSIVFFS